MLAIVDFFLGTFIGPKNTLDYARGFIGYNGNYDIGFEFKNSFFFKIYQILP